MTRISIPGGLRSNPLPLCHGLNFKFWVHGEETLCFLESCMAEQGSNLRPHHIPRLLRRLWKPRLCSILVYYIYILAIKKSWFPHFVCELKRDPNHPTIYRAYHPGAHETSTQCRCNAGPPSATVAHHKATIGWVSGVDWHSGFAL